MEMCAAAERGGTREAPPRAQNRHEEEPSAMEKNLVLLRRTCSAAIFSEDLASGVEQSNVVELLRGKALCRLPPNSTLHPVGQRTETATEKSWPPRGGSRGTRLPRA